MFKTGIHCTKHLQRCNFFYEENFIENQQKRGPTKTIYRFIYKIYIQSTTNFKIQTLYSIHNKKNYYEVWTIKSENCTSN